MGFIFSFFEKRMNASYFIIDEHTVEYYFEIIDVFISIQYTYVSIMYNFIWRRDTHQSRREFVSDEIYPNYVREYVD